jgi:hypothetical protein
MASKRIALMSTLLLVLCLSASVQAASAQTTSSHYWVSVNPATSSTIVYGDIEKNWTIPFQAVWSYGENSGKAVENAAVTVEVKTDDGVSVENISQTTNSTGFATFYYVSSKPAVLTFTPTSVVTEDEIEYTASLFGSGQSAVYGMQSESVTVYWDTFDASLVSTDTGTQGVTTVSANITYMPEEGLTIPNSSPEQVFPKIAHGANVTINGVKAEESSVSGVYTANFSTWLPTTYVFIEVSHDEWLPAHKGFSFDHKSNSTLWTPAIAIILVAAVVLVLFSRVFRRTEGTSLLDRAGFPVFGGALLALASFISLYWGAVGLDSTLSGFDWAWLAASELLSFGFGLVGSIMSLMKKKQALVIFAVCIPMLTNVIAIKAALDAYQLAVPWLIIVPSFVISVLSGILISNADKRFKD